MTAVAHQVTPFLTSYEVMARYHISYTTLWRRIKDRSLPQPRINRNTRNKLWHIEDLEEYEKKED
ncbi:MAG: DNA-binding protein [Marinomonas sp.]|uniref:helix-turn-helix transcriptional regulator n=1 Tax=Marinomonas sp. TaxID=1904862 RepID=UPI003C717921